MGAKRIHLRDVPTRLATGAYILHSGLEKWQGDEERAQALHGFAAGAYPLLAKVPPTTFLKALAVVEIGLGAALLTPVVPNRLAGAALSAFSGGSSRCTCGRPPCTSRTACGRHRPVRR